MFPRTNYEMSDADLLKILDASKPTPVMYISGGSQMFSTPQENANRAWAELGQRMGFDPMTVQPISGKGYRFFTAVPTENQQQREERFAREAEEKRLRDIQTLTDEIAERQAKLEQLTNTTK